MDEDPQYRMWKDRLDNELALEEAPSGSASDTRIGSDKLARSLGWLQGETKPCFMHRAGRIDHSGAVYSDHGPWLLRTSRRTDKAPSSCGGVDRLFRSSPSRDL
jgi:hypothetical protein